MATRLTARYVVIFTFLFIGVVASQAFSQSLTATELWELMDASRQRYASYDVEGEQYIVQSGAQDGPRSDVSTFLWRSQGERTYVKITQDDRNGEGVPATFHYAVNNQAFRTMTDWWGREGDPDPEFVGSGSVSALEAAQEDMPTTPSMMMWDPISPSFDFEEITNNADKVDYDPASKQYTISSPLSPAMSIEITLDASKDYVMLSQRIVSSDGKIGVEFVNSDWQEVNGLWFPKKMEKISHANGDRVVMLVSKAELNSSIPEDDLDFVFPDGYFITDKISQLRYVVGQIDKEGYGEKLDLSGDLEQQIIRQEDLDQGEPIEAEKLEAAYDQSKLTPAITPESKSGYWYWILLGAAFVIVLGVVGRKYLAR